jgi:methyl-accepting chemotaxis protein
MTKKKKLSLAGKIILIISVIFIIIFSFMLFVLTSQISKGVFEREKHNTIQASNQFEEFIEQIISGISRRVSLLADSNTLIDNITENNSEKINLLLKKSYESESFFENIIVADKNKKILAAYPHENLKGSDVSNYQFWNDLMANKNATHIDKKAYKSPLSGNPIITISSNIFNGNNLIGVYIVVIDLTKFSDNYIKNKKFGKDGYAYMAGLDGTVIAHPRKELILTDFSKYDFQQKIVNSNEKSGFFKYYWEVDKKFKYMAYQKLEILPWYISSTIYEEDLMSLSNSLRNQILIISICSLIILIIVLMLTIVFFVAKPVGKVTNDLGGSANNLESASYQISSSSQELSSGSSELASSIEEITSSLEELQSVIESNTKNINQSELMMRETNDSVKDVSDKTTQLKNALLEINENSKKVVKIIKVIDDIAFQTNILALNAAVEAARAGDAGRGFAVVADQVKTLAQKSAEAAKETAELIEKAINSVAKGESLGNIVLEVQLKLVEKSEKVSSLLNEVNMASKEQMKGINQITQAVTQTNTVVQQTASSAEENAAASEELLTQAENLNNIVDLLNLLVKGKIEQKEIKSRKKNTDNKIDVVKQKQIIDKTSKESQKPEDKIPMEDFSDF